LGLKTLWLPDIVKDLFCSIRKDFMKIDRRRFLVTSGASSGLFLTACKTTSSDLKGEDRDRLVRKRWDPEAEDEIKLKFIKAIDWLKANDDKTFEQSDPRSYLSYKKIVTAHQKSCKHGDWLIFPWHRLYLAYFENACRYALEDASFAVPYWDWTVDRRIPEEFFHNPLLMANRTIKEEEEIPEEFVAPKVIEDILSSENFGNIHSNAPRPIMMRGGANSGAFERGPHNGVHNSIGGTMANPFNSPEDPIFWLHHSNIDRIWATWQHRHPDKVLPYSKTEDNTADPSPWETKILELVEDSAKGKGSQNTVLRTQVQSNFNREASGRAKVSDILNTNDLGYTYDTIPKPVFQNKIAIHPDRRPRVDTQLSGSLTVATDRLITNIALQERDAAALIASFKARTDAMVSLVADGLDAPLDDPLRSQVVLRFFLIAGKNVSLRAEFFEHSVIDLPEYVGTHSFFGHPNHEGNPTSTSSSMDLSRSLRKLLSKGSTTDIQLVALALNPKKNYSGAPIFTREQNLRLFLDFTFLAL
jgi:hypothetical protein